MVDAGCGVKLRRHRFAVQQHREVFVACRQLKFNGKCAVVAHLVAVSAEGRYPTRCSNGEAGNACVSGYRNVQLSYRGGDANACNGGNLSDGCFINTPSLRCQSCVCYCRRVVAFGNRKGDGKCAVVAYGVGAAAAGYATCRNEGNVFDTRTAGYKNTVLSDISRNVDGPVSGNLSDGCGIDSLTFVRERCAARERWRPVARQVYLKPQHKGAVVVYGIRIAAAHPVC